MNIFAILGYIVVIYLIGVSLSGFDCYYMFMDGPTLVFTLAFFLLTLWGTGTIKNFINGIKIGLHLKKTYSLLDLKKSEETLNLLTRSSLVAGGILCMTGWLDTLYHMEDPSFLGPLVAMGLRSILYALIIALFLTTFKGRIHMLLIAYAEENSTKEEELSEELLEQRVFYLFRSKGLTDREAEIARLISQELTNHEIAGKLYISEATVKKHITHILEKLGLERREAIIDLIQNETAPKNTFTINPETEQ